MEQRRLSGSSFLVVVRVYQLDYEGIYETIDIASGHSDLSEALAKAQSIAAVRMVNEWRELDGDGKWKRESVRNHWPQVRPEWLGNALPIFADRFRDGTGWKVLEVTVAVIPTDPKSPINGDVVRAIDMMPELVAWFSKVRS